MRENGRMKGIVASRDAGVECLDIPRHVEQLLALHGIKTVRDLESWTDSEILALDGFDVKALAKLKYGLAKDGYNLGRPPDSDASCYRFEDPWHPKPRNMPFTKRWEDYLPPSSRGQHPDAVAHSERNTRLDEQGRPPYEKPGIAGKGIQNEQGGTQRIRSKHAAYSVLRERIVEHVFIGDAMRRLWQLGIFDVEVLRGEFDTSGYDLVMICGNVIRHIQFKASLVDGSRGNISVNLKLGQTPSGCVIWLGVTDDLEIVDYRWFGGKPGHSLPEIADRAPARHTRANADGVKAERPNQRILAKGEFEALDGLDGVLNRLFGTSATLDCHSSRAWDYEGKQP
jgi:hypothetical protein